MGGVIEFTYYFIKGIATNDSELLSQIFGNLYTTGVVGVMLAAFEGFWKILLIWWYDSIVQLVQLSWNTNIFMLWTSWFAVQLGWV